MKKKIFVYKKKYAEMCDHLTGLLFFKEMVVQAQLHNCNTAVEHKRELLQHKRSGGMHDGRSKVIISMVTINK